MQSHIAYLWKEPQASQPYRAAISLHGHTHHSKESLFFIEQYARRRPLLRFALQLQDRRSRRGKGIRLDFHKGYWTPPLAPFEAYNLERRQIEETLDLEGMVSLTDHDNIEAPVFLRAIESTRSTPVSLEWSVPFEGTVFHVGVHNLPPAHAEHLFGQLNTYTQNPKPANLQPLIVMLHEIPEVLLVLNHPLWDLPGVGAERHLQALQSLLQKMGAYLHALELNGLRDWKENQAVAELAAGWNLPIISGGDRHGCEPSAMLNLTNAANFSEFVHEIRKDRQSTVLVLPQYTESIALRCIQTVLDVIRPYPEYPLGARVWDERVYHPDKNGVFRSLAMLWDHPAAFIEQVFGLLRMVQHEPVRSAMKSTLCRPQREIQFSLGRPKEATP